MGNSYNQSLTSIKSTEPLCRNSWTGNIFQFWVDKSVSWRYSAIRSFYLFWNVLKNMRNNVIIKKKQYKLQTWDIIIIKTDVNVMGARCLRDKGHIIKPPSTCNNFSLDSIILSADYQFQSSFPSFRSIHRKRRRLTKQSFRKAGYMNL